MKNSWVSLIETTLFPSGQRAAPRRYGDENVQAGETSRARSPLFHMKWKRIVGFLYTPLKMPSWMTQTQSRPSPHNPEQQAPVWDRQWKLPAQWNPDYLTEAPPERKLNIVSGRKIKVCDLLVSGLPPRCSYPTLILPCNAFCLGLVSPRCWGRRQLTEHSFPARVSCMM